VNSFTFPHALVHDEITLLKPISRQ
jgi:hypothetical protein